jgi:AcrR family transcriptional regulator
MVTKPQAVNQGGRPRSFSDDAVFRATGRVLARLGHSRLTLPAVAAELGCTRQTLIHRFGTKRDLQLAYAAWASDRIATRFRTVRAQHASPLAALRARFMVPAQEDLAELTEPAGYAHFVGFLVEAQYDEGFRENFVHPFRRWEAEVATLIEEARTAGELIDGDPAEVAHQLFVAAMGASLVWAADPHGSIIDELLRAFEMTIAPYRPSAG